MKKTESINIGGQAFIIDTDAFDQLDNYLDSLNAHLSSHDGCEEIMEDIEIRISELLHDELKYRNVVTLKDIDKVIGIMGTAKDLGMEDEFADSGAFSNSFSEDSHATTNALGATAHDKLKRRLFRDEDRKVVGGVAAGLSTYFGITNPIWLRILFVFSIFIFTPVVYIVLWILVPAARTASDRLAMKGEPINIDNIVKTVEDELSDLKEKIEDIGKGIQSKKKSRRHFHRKVKNEFQANY